MEHLAKTIPDLFKDAVEAYGERQAIAAIEAGRLLWRTWHELSADVQRRTEEFAEAGVGQGDRVVQWAPNSYDWVVVDLAILSLGAVHVPLHASLSGQQAEELIERAKPRLVVGTEEKATAGQPSDAASQPAEGLATILFTSGTTGEPRGVMLTHANLVANAVATIQAVEATSDETRLCILPLSHIYARTCDLYTWLVRGTKLVLAESRETILRDCQLAQPTAINAVPYFYQKVAEQLQAAGKADEPGALVNALGGKLKRCFCGGAGVSPAVERVFEQQKMPLLSGYGLTEASPVVSASSASNYRAGTVGQPLPNVEVELAAEGEILVRGPGVMRGYWQDDVATSEVLQEGWLRTGDLGEFDHKGNLKITGRKKEMIVLSTGKNISPGEIEKVLVGSPLIENVCVVGDGQKCLGAIIVPNREALRGEIRRRKLWVWSKRRAVTHPVVRNAYRKELDRLLEECER